MKPKLNYYDVDDDVVAFSTTRHGGVSKGNYGEFNINAYCGDEPEAIAENRNALEKEIGIADNSLIMPHQVHSAHNLSIDHRFLTLTPEERQLCLEGIDSLTTNLSGVCIGVSTADCIPILLYDPVNYAVAAVHAGWRGTVQRIVMHTLQSMKKDYGTHPKDVCAVVGPGISLKNFEVGQEVYDAFASEHFPMSVIARKYPQTHKWHIDLPLCNLLQLNEAGVPFGNIFMSGICTYDSVGDFFSARRLGINSGRIFTGIMMR